MADNEVGKVSLGIDLNVDDIGKQAPALEKAAGEAGEKAGKKTGEKLSETAGKETRRGFEKITRQSGESGEEAGRRYGSRFQSGLRKEQGGILKAGSAIMSKLAGIFAAKKLFDFAKESISLGSDLAEVQNVVDSTFGRGSSATKAVNEFAENAAAQFGLSETMAKRYAGTFGAMAKAFGFANDKAVEMSTQLTGLAGDVASFYNITQDEAYTKLKSVFTGETESLKDLGVVMTQTALNDYAMRSGIGKTVDQMTEAEKVSLRYGFVMDQLSTAGGDFARTADGWANQVRLLSLQFDSLKANIGQGLIAALGPVIQAINRFVALLVKASAVFRQFMQELFGVAPAAQKMGAAVEGALGGITDSAGDAIKGVSGVGGAASDSAKKAQKAVKDLKRTLEGFDEIIKVKDETQTSSGSGAGSGAGGVGSGALDAAAGLAEMSEAMGAAEENTGRFAAIIERLRTMLQPTADALKKLGETLGKGLIWLWENVLVPFGTWTGNEVLPRFFTILADVLEILNSTINFLKPAFQWFWDNLLQPLLKWQGEIFIAKLDLIIKALDSLKEYFADLPNKVNHGIETVRKCFRDAKKKLEEWIKKVKEKLQPLIDKINEVRNLFKKIPDKMSFEGSVSLVRKGWTSIEGWTRRFLGNPVDKPIGLSKNGWNTVSGWVSGFMGGAVDKGVGLFKQGWDTVKGWVDGYSAGNTGKKVDLQKNGWNTVQGWVNGYNGGAVTVAVNLARGGVDWMIKKAFGAASGGRIQLGADVITRFASGGSIFGGKINKYADGTAKAHGTMFLAGEAGPEIVGNVNGSTEVLNKSQIARAVSDGVARIMMRTQFSRDQFSPHLAQMGTQISGDTAALVQLAREATQASRDGSMTEILQILRDILYLLQHMDMDIKIDGVSVKDRIVRLINANTRATGKCEIVMT